MVDLSFRSSTLGAIERQKFPNILGPRIGASKIGHSCERFLWYKFRWCFASEITHQKKRLFERGHLEEKRFQKILSSIGIEVFDDQLGVPFAFNHGYGRIDGKCTGVIEASKTVHLAEFKTMNDRNFKELCKKTVFNAKPEYFAQCQIYMNLVGLKRTLFMAVNKNNDAIYVERLYYDKDFAEELLLKAETIVLSEFPPHKKFDSTWYQCKFCDARGICHNGQPLTKSCRICKNINICNDGKWECDITKETLSTKEQRIICDNFKIINFQ